jgi:MFS family permease
MTIVLANRFFDHSLFATLRSLRGNVRGAVFTEPLWGIPYNLYAPYVSVYMLALGLTDSQIGLLASIGLACQIFWTMLSGAITDKFGRKRTTLITDIIAWSIPCLIWAFAQDFNAFLLAAIVNSTWRITHNSWLCILVEGTDPKILVDVYSLIYISGLLAAFFSPLAGLLIAHFSLVPTMRGLYLLAFVMMTTKFFTMNAMVEETEHGLDRMRATRHQSIFAIVGDTRGVLPLIFRSPETMVTAGLMVIVAIATLIQNTFWSVVVTERLQIAPEYLAFYTVGRSITMLVFYFTVMPMLRTVDARKPMVFGFLGLILSWSILITIPPQSYLLLMVAVILEGCSVPAVSTLLDKLIATTVAAQERARIMAVLYLIMLTATSPFGWIAGQASQINRSLPFVINIVLFTFGALLAFLASRRGGETPVEAADAVG